MAESGQQQQEEERVVAELLMIYQIKLKNKLTSRLQNKIFATFGKATCTSIIHDV